MPLFNNPFSLEIPVKIGYLNVIFFINENLYVTSDECFSVPHNHHDYELRYIESGVCNQIIENSSIIASEGELIIVHPMEFHCQYHEVNQTHSSQYNIRFFIEPPPENNQQQQKAYAKAEKLLREARVLHDENGVILFYLQRLTQEVYNKRSGYIGAVQSFSSLILTEMLRIFEEAAESLFPMDELRYSGYERTRIDELFRRRYLTDMKIEDFANDMKLSTRQINRIMYKMFGMSFTQKLKEMRLMHAAFLLKNTNKAVTEISLECGFKTYSNFYTCFQKKFGISPSDFKNENTDNITT